MADVFDRAYLVSIVALPLVAVAGVLGPSLVGMTNLSILGLYLAVPMVLAAAVLWRFDGPRDRDPLAAVAIDWRVLSVAFHVVVAVLVLSLTVYEVRPLSFHAGLAVLYALIFLLIWVPGFDAGRVPISLYHTAVAVTLAIFSVTLKYDFFVGNTDLTAHVSMIDSLVDPGAPALMDLYEPFQLWHVYVAVTHQLFGGHLTTHRTTYLLGGLLFGAGVFASYGLARRVTSSERIALLTALFTISHPFYVFYGMYSIPRSVTSILFLTLLLTLVGRATTGTRLLGLAFVVAIVLYHPVSIPFVFVILSIVYVVERVVRSRPTVADRPVIVENVTMVTIGLVTLTYWLYSAETLVETIVGTLYASFFGPTSEPTPQGVVESPWVEVANYVPYSFFVFFVLLGALLWLRERPDGRTAFGVFGVSALLLVPLSVPGPTLLLDSLVGINVSRFGHYTFMFFALTGAAGAYRLLTRGGVKLFVVLLLLVSLFAFTAVSNDFVARDNPAVERPFYTYYLTEQERESYEHVDAMYAGQVETDRPTCRYMGEMMDADCLVVDAGAEEGLFAGAERILIRHGELEDRPLQFTAYVPADDVPHDELAARDRIYDSESVSLYA